MIRAAVTSSVDGPVHIEELLIDDPGPGEVLVKIRASGICHTDFLAPQIVPLPAVLGHEGAGEVIAVGDGVDSVAIGDRVVGSYGYCGQCPRCQSGAPYHCSDFSRIQLGSRRHELPPLHRADGTPVSGAFFEQSSFATHALMTARNVVPVTQDVPFEYLAPLGCGVLTGFGSVSNVFRPSPGQGIVVLGAGGVGLPAVMAAKLAGCDPIVAIDVKPARLALARELGATHAIDGLAEDIVASVRDLTHGGADFCLETVGQAATFNLAIDMAKSGGTCGFVVVPNLGQPFEIRNGRALLSLTLAGIIEGRAAPGSLIGHLASLIAAGELPMDRYTTTFEFDDVNEALAAGQTGSAAKPVLRMPATS